MTPTYPNTEWIEVYDKHIFIYNHITMLTILVFTFRNRWMDALEDIVIGLSKTPRSVSCLCSPIGETPNNSPIKKLCWMPES